MSVFVGVGDITRVKDVEVIVNAANGIGIMGAGLAGALARSGGETLTDAAREHCKQHGPFPAGSCYRTSSGLLKKTTGAQEIYHAVTMKFPGMSSSIDDVVKALRSVLNEAMIQGVKSIAIPGLGTGIGGLDKVQVAQRMAATVAPYVGHIPRIIIVDSNKVFIEAFQSSSKVPCEPWETT